MVWELELFKVWQDLLPHPLFSFFLSLIHAQNRNSLVANSRRKHSDSIDSVDTVSKRFSDLVNYCESTKFRGFEYPRRYWEMSSFEETKALQICSSPESRSNFVHYNRRNLSRIYPRGTRLLSSNFDPVPLWLVGCQMVALNYQAKDRPLMFSRAMFRQNARAGFVLKPWQLRGEIC